MLKSFWRWQMGCQARLVCLLVLQLLKPTFFVALLHRWVSQAASCARTATGCPAHFPFIPPCCAVMTYDYSLPQQPGPNAPLPWWERNADAFAEAADRCGAVALQNILLALLMP